MKIFGIAAASLLVASGAWAQGKTAADGKLFGMRGYPSTNDAAQFFPFIDQFGQYKHKDWPGKTKAEADLKVSRDEEKAGLAKDPQPAEWDKWGGWAAGPKHDASGFFRAEKFDGKWWLVDPDGRLFFSHGVDCVRESDLTPIDERSSWFDPQPASMRRLEKNASCLKGHYAGKSPRCFPFGVANLIRKYGTDWETVYPDVIQQRLRSWGLNTIGNWSDAKTFQLRRTPYTDSVGVRRVKDIEGSEGYWGKFPDPFDDAFGKSVRTQMTAKAGKSADDPWCLGYFSDNEMSWGGDGVSLAIAALRSPPEQAAKKIFAEDLKKKYGAIAKLNETWGTKYESWDALLQSRDAPDKKKAEDDLKAFYSRIAEQYFKTVRDEIKKTAPHQLYLGCRFAAVNPRAAAAAAKFCDVVSYNLYRKSIAEFHADGAEEKPLLVGEFHFGALDRGMFHTGLVKTSNQVARAAAYKNYVEGALKHPQFVGTHWFKYQDEPVTGRVHDEENYQIGFVDVCDTPYPETIVAIRKVSREMYTLRAAK